MIMMMMMTIIISIMADANCVQVIEGRSRSTISKDIHEPGGIVRRGREGGTGH